MNGKHFISGNLKTKGQSIAQRNPGQGPERIHSSHSFAELDAV